MGCELWRFCSETTIPVEEVDAEKEKQKGSTVVIIKAGDKSLGELLRGLLG